MKFSYVEIPSSIKLSDEVDTSLLNGLKVIMLLLIVAGHFFGFFSPTRCTSFPFQCKHFMIFQCHSFVTNFLIMSGMLYSLNEAQSTFDYVCKRFSKFYLYYLTGLICGWLSMICMQEVVPKWDVFLQLSVFGRVFIFWYDYSNTPLWFLAYLMVYSFLLPLIHRLFAKLRSKELILCFIFLFFFPSLSAIAIYYIAGFFTDFNIPNCVESNFFVALLHLNPFIRLLHVCFGLIIGLLLKRKYFLPKSAFISDAMTVQILTSAFFMCFVMTDTIMFFFCDLVLSIFPIGGIWIYALCAPQQGRISNFLFSCSIFSRQYWFSQYAFGAYIFHYPTLYTVAALMGNRNGYAGAYFFDNVDLIYLFPLILFVSVIMMHGIEVLRKVVSI